MENAEVVKTVYGANLFEVTNFRLGETADLTFFKSEGCLHMV